MSKIVFIKENSMEVREKLKQAGYNVDTTATTLSEAADSVLGAVRL